MTCSMFLVIHFIRELRKRVYSEENRERMLLMNILKTWQSIKRFREEQGYINTSSTLKIRKYDILISRTHFVVI